MPAESRKWQRFTALDLKELKVADIKIGRMVLGPVGTNCYFIHREGSSEAIVFDPADRGDHIYETLRQHGLAVSDIFLTHAHFDHIWGSNELRSLSGAKVHALDAERVLCEDAAVNYSAQAGRAYTVDVDEYVFDGDVITSGGISFKVIATPGHTVGSCSYYFEEAGFLLSGDTLFMESVGRTDLPTGSGAQIQRSLNDRLLILPENTQVYPGHGDMTTIGHEKKYNPFAG